MLTPAAKGSAPHPGHLGSPLGLVQSTPGSRGLAGALRDPPVSITAHSSVSRSTGGVSCAEVCRRRLWPARCTGDPANWGLQAGWGPSGPRTGHTGALAHPPAPGWQILIPYGQRSHRLPGLQAPFSSESSVRCPGPKHQTHTRESGQWVSPVSAPTSVAHPGQTQNLPTSITSCPSDRQPLRRRPLPTWVSPLRNVIQMAPR